MAKQWHPVQAVIQPYWHAVERRAHFYWCPVCEKVHSPHFPKERISIRLYLEAFDPQRDMPLHVSNCVSCSSLLRIKDHAMKLWDNGDLTAQEFSRITTMINRSIYVN